MNHSPGVKGPAIAGTALCILCNLSSTDIAHTVILAAIGAAVSFTVSLLLKAAWQRWRH